MSRLVLVRHGQSIWNLQNRFTGWVDISLSRKGMQEAEQAVKAHRRMAMRKQSLLFFEFRMTRFQPNP